MESVRCRQPISTIRQVIFNSVRSSALWRGVKTLRHAQRPLALRMVVTIRNKKRSGGKPILIEFQCWNAIQLTTMKSRKTPPVCLHIAKERFTGWWIFGSKLQLPLSVWVECPNKRQKLRCVSYGTTCLLLHVMRSLKTAALSTTVWMVETQLCKRGRSDVFV